MKSVYILLTRSNTYFSRMIAALSGDNYTHCSIALDKDFKRTYSFGRRYWRFILPAGLIKEDVHSGIFKRDESNPCSIYELQVSEQVYQRIEQNIMKMMQNAKHYRYSVIGVLLCKLDIRYERSHRYFCSQFVGEILEESEALHLSKPTCLLKPADFCDMPELRELYQGTIKNALQEKVFYS